MDSFSSISKFLKVDFMPNSELQIIGINAFNSSNIENFTILESALIISDRAFFGCKYLRHLGIPENSMLQKIEREAFAYSAVESFWIPPHITQIENGIFNKCNNINIIEIAENSELPDIDPTSFTDKENTLIMVPVSFKKILI